MAKKKTQIPKYGTITLKGIQYYRTRITDADGKELSLYAATCEELYEKQLEARKQHAVELFFDLLKCFIIADGCNRHSGDGWIFCSTYSKTVQIIGLPGKKSGDFGKYTDLIFNVKRDPSSFHTFIHF